MVNPRITCGTSNIINLKNHLESIEGEMNDHTFGDRIVRLDISPRCERREEEDVYKEVENG